MPLAALFAVLVLVVPPAAAQSGPDAAPTGSSGPAPDPAPTGHRPASRAAKPAVAVRARTPTQPSTSPAPTAPSAPVVRHRATRHRKPTKRHTSTTTPRPAVVLAPALPHVTPARLVSPPSDGGEQARRLAIGGLSLLLLALASAMLLAFTLRVDRNRTVR